MSRIEELEAEQVEWIDGRTVIQYRGQLTPIIGCDGGPAAAWQDGGRRPLLVFARDDRAVGLLVEDIVDIVESALSPDMTSSGAGALGGLIIGGVATELIDIDYYWRRALWEEDEVAPSPPSSRQASAVEAPAHSRRLLLVDQSPFSQLLLQPLLAQAGYQVTVAADPAAALRLYDAGEHFHLIMADTSDPAEARAFATAFGRAANWHRTPLMSLAVHAAPIAAASGGFDRKTLLDAVSEAMSDRERAA